MSAMFQAFRERIHRVKPWMNSTGTCTEVIEMLLEDGEQQPESEFVGTQTIVVA